MFTWWQVSRSAVHTKKPDTDWAVVVMRKMGCSGVSRGASGNQEMLGPVGAIVASEPGAIPTTSSPKWSDNGTSRLKSCGDRDWMLKSVGIKDAEEGCVKQKNYVLEQYLV